MRVHLGRWLSLVILVFSTATAFAQSADLTVTKNGPATAAADTDVVYGVLVTNLGLDDASPATLTDPIPAGMTFVSMVQNSGPLFGCSTPAPGTGGTISCTIATLTSGSSTDFTVTLHIPPGTPGSTFFTNTATVSSGLLGTFDPNSENDSSTATTSTPSIDADVAVTKTGPSEAFPNADVAYTITVQNNGAAAATSVALSDPLPGTMTFVSLVQNSGPGFSCVEPSAGAGGTVTCSIATLANGAGASFTLTAHIPSGTVSGTVFTNIASVTSAQDPTPENDSATAGTAVASADLALSMNGPASVNAGAPLSYTIDVANGGPDATTGTISVADTLPVGATAASGSGSGWACGAPSGGVITCTSTTSVASGSSFPTLTIAMTAPPNSGNVQNSATVSSSADPNPANDSASVTTNIAALTDISIVKSGPGSVVSGQNIVYTIVVTNAGPSPATGVVVSDPTPPSLTFVSNSGACTTAYPCNLGTMAAGQSATITSTYSTPPTFSGNVSNTATVSATTPDPNAANNSATAVTNVSNAVDLAITKTASAPPYLIGTPITYTIVVTNAGPASAAGVSVTDVIPPGTTFTSATPSQGSCSGTTTVTCALGTIASGGSATISLVLTLPSTPGSVQNTATVTTSNPDTNPANNSSTAAISNNVAMAIPAMTSLGLLLLVLIIFGSVAMRRRLP